MLYFLLLPCLIIMLNFVYNCVQLLHDYGQSCTQVLVCTIDCIRVYHKTVRKAGVFRASSLQQGFPMICSAPAAGQARHRVRGASPISDTWHQTGGEVAVYGSSKGSLLGSSRNKRACLTFLNNSSALFNGAQSRSILASTHWGLTTYHAFNVRLVCTN